MRPLFFSLRPPRHPLARFALGLAGLLLLGVFGLIGLVGSRFWIDVKRYAIAL